MGAEVVVEDVELIEMPSDLYRRISALPILDQLSAVLMSRMPGMDVRVYAAWRNPLENCWEIRDMTVSPIKRPPFE